MTSDFKIYFRKCLNQLKTQGWKSFKDELPQLREKTDSPEATKSFLHFVADLCTEFKNYDQAITLLLSIESRFGLSDVGYNNLAFCYWRLEQEADAYSAYKKSLSLNAESLSSRRGACFLAIETDHDIEAVEHCRKFIQADPKSDEAPIWFATALWNADLNAELKEFIAQREREFGPDDELREFMPKN